MASKGAPEAAPDANAAAGGRGEPPRNYMPSKRLQQTQAQVDEVVDIMRVNVEKVLERDQKLSELDNRAEALQVGASRFEQSAGKLKNKYWWANMKTSAQHFERSAVRLKRKFWWQNIKMTIILVGVVAIVVIAGVVWVMTGQKQEGAAAPPPANYQGMPQMQPQPSLSDNGMTGGNQDYDDTGVDNQLDDGAPDDVGDAGNGNQ